MQKLWENIYRPNYVLGYNPFLLNNMDIAINRIVKAINEREKIVIYGCCNVDGICGISILMLVLKYLNADVEYYISEDKSNNICKDIIENHIKALGAKIVISLGCNLDKDIEDILISMNIDFIGLIGSTPEQCNLTIVEGENLTISTLTFKFVQAIAVYYNMKNINKYVDLVLLGNGSYNKKVKGENLILYEEGLKYLTKTKNYGIRALMKHLNIRESREENVEKIVCAITPTINAVGKLDNARIAVELLTTNNYYRAEQIAKYLDREFKTI